MPRKVNYEEKIAKLDKQIADREEQLKKLKKEREELVAADNKIKNAVLLQYMKDNNMTAGDVVNMLKASSDAPKKEAPKKK